MQTAKSKAEAYVRSKIPELMELSFGCEVQITNSELWRLVGGKVTVGGGYRAHAGHSYIDVAELDCQIKKGNAEIIGHPIQLHHWLRVLAHIADFTIELYAITDECDVNVRKNDRKYCIKINLSTGQPATEEDYTAFLTIVGE